MKTTRIALTALALLALLTTPALCQVWQEQQITSGFKQWRGLPVVWDDTVYYGEMGWDGISEVYAWNQAQGSRKLIGGDGISRAPAAVWQDKLVVYRVENNQHKLYLYDASGVETPISASTGDKFDAGIFGETVVWDDNRSGVRQVYVWDPINGERRISPTSADQTNPKVWGDTVVWEDQRNGRADVYMWNPRDGERRLSTYISGMMAPAIYGDRVTMWLIGGSYSEDRGLWEWTPQHGLRQLWHWNYTRQDDVMYARMWGDMVVWQQGLGPSAVGAWDPVHGLTRVPQSTLSSSGAPSVFQNRVAWVGDYDIYLSTLVPEPSGLTALAGCTGMLLLFRRRRA